MSTRPDEDPLTFNPPPPNPNLNEVEKEGTLTKKKINDDVKKLKDRYYSELEEQGFQLVVWKAESINNSYEFSDGKTNPYKPISNIVWKEMTRKKRQLQEIQSKIGPGDIKSLVEVEVEEEIDGYYAKMCEIYYGMNREEFDNLPPAETILAVKATNHKTLYPLKIKRNHQQQRQGQEQEQEQQKQQLGPRLGYLKLNSFLVH